MCTDVIFPALPCVLLPVACFAEKRLLVVFLAYLLYVSFFLCFFFFFFPLGHNALLLIRHAHTGRRGDTDRKDDSQSDAGSDASEWGESGGAITGSAAGPFTGGKKTTRLGSWSPSLLASRVIYNRSGLMNETQVTLAVQSFSSSGDRGLRKIFVITWLLHNEEKQMICRFHSFLQCSGTQWLQKGW